MAKVAMQCSGSYSATLGALTFSSLLVAASGWSRLRGWYGYKPKSCDPAGPDALLLTHTASIHTVGMPFALDVFWLDAGMRCIGWQLNVRPWRCSWHRQATHVIERPINPDDRSKVPSVYRQPLTFISRPARH